MSEQNEQLSQKHRATIAKAAAVVRTRGHEGDARLADSLHGILASLVAAEDRRAQPAPTVQAEPRRSTDLSRKLRAIATMPFSPADFVLFTQAADEIERYYGGMLNWKATADDKDVEIIRLRAAPAHASSDGRDAKDAAAATKARTEEA